MKLTNRKLVPVTPRGQEPVCRCYAEALRMISPVYCMEDIVVPVSQIPRALEVAIFKNRLREQEILFMARNIDSGGQAIHSHTGLDFILPK